jgi:glycosyltransferase involved in cell wall biosynthesis
MNRSATAVNETHTPRVSIGMPVYNGQSAVRRAIESLLGQSFGDFEIIISDNASTDATGDICREYVGRDNRVQYFRQPENIGAPRNFHFVLDKARGDDFMWAAYDDLWRPQFIEKCLSALERDPEIAVAFTRYWVLSRKYAPLKMRYFPDLSILASDDPFTRVSSYMSMPEFTHKANVIYGLWRREAVREMVDTLRDVADQFAAFGLDVAQVAHVLARSKACQVPEVLFFKTYEGLPPGYITIVGHILKRRLLKYKRWKKRHESNVRNHIEVVRIALARAGADDERYSRFLDELQTRLINRYERPRDILRELYRSIRSGLI